MTNGEGQQRKFMGGQGGEPQGKERAVALLVEDRDTVPHSATGPIGCQGLSPEEGVVPCPQLGKGGTKVKGEAGRAGGREGEALGQRCKELKLWGGESPKAEEEQGEGEEKKEAFHTRS